jgi:hypothetical protein
LVINIYFLFCRTNSVRDLIFVWFRTWSTMVVWESTSCGSQRDIARNFQAMANACYFRGEKSITWKLRAISLRPPPPPSAFLTLLEGTEHMAYKRKHTRPRKSHRKAFAHFVCRHEHNCLTRFNLTSLPPPERCLFGFCGTPPSPPLPPPNTGERKWIQKAFGFGTPLRLDGTQKKKKKESGETASRTTPSFSLLSPPLPLSPYPLLSPPPQPLLLALRVGAGGVLVFRPRESYQRVANACIATEEEPNAAPSA